MSASYNPELASDTDWVRFLIGDVDEAAAKLSDEEIGALLVEEPNKYLAAARALEGLYGQWTTLGTGVVEKQVGDLRIRKIAGQSSENAITGLIRSLRQRGAELTLKQPRAFRVL